MKIVPPLSLVKWVKNRRGSTTIAVLNCVLIELPRPSYQGRGCLHWPYQYCIRSPAFELMRGKIHSLNSLQVFFSSDSNIEEAGAVHKSSQVVIDYVVELDRLRFRRLYLVKLSVKKVERKEAARGEVWLVLLSHSNM